MVDASVQNFDEAISSLDSSESSVSDSLKHLRWVLAVRGHMLEGLDVPDTELGHGSLLRKSLGLGTQSIEPKHRTLMGEQTGRELLRAPLCGFEPIYTSLTTHKLLPVQTYP